MPEKRYSIVQKFHRKLPAILHPWVLSRKEATDFFLYVIKPEREKQEMKTKTGGQNDVKNSKPSSRHIS